ncbi:MAG TPA: sulfotransferase [Candidatus Acidoferrales bacterium]|jgi:tetratricopeptide (TPR) repeat protein|nr:sulfotransferase [Candidatus Acidoferrales bacterium]
MNPVSLDESLNKARRLLESYDFSQALAAYEKLTRQFPRNARIWVEYGAAAAGTGQLDLADRAWNKALELEPGNSENLLQVGHQYKSLRQPEKARAWYEKASAADLKSINPRMALAILAEQNHSFAEAREAVASCLAIDPRDDQARYYAAFLDRREGKMEDAERQLRDLIASDPRHQYVQYASRYELAEVLNRTGRFDEAMQVLIEAKDMVRRLGNIDVMLKEYDREAGQYAQSSRELPKNILRTWAREFPERTRYATLKLVFLGGHPRSGTTLLEQILGAHPDVAALDESQAFTMIVAKLFNESQQISPARLNVIRRRYLEAVQREWGSDLKGKLLLDKNPSPTAKLRIWLRVFPELRVLIALRDPRDVVISCYFQNLPLNAYSANFLTLERTARHYADLMDVWLAVRQWESLTWMETRYEDTVADLEKEGRRVNGFLGLEWDEAQGRFQEKSGNKQMYSPTYRDASQPVYARSVARWHAYEKYLTPILPILEPYCQAFGY